MINKLLVISLMMIAVVGRSNAGSITWSYSADLGSSFQGGWLVELVEDVNKDGISIGGGLGDIVADHTISSDDAYIGANVTTVLSSGKGGTTWLSNFSAPASTLGLSDAIYTVIYNATTFAAATQYIVVDSTPWTLPSLDGDATYNQTAAPSGSWQNIAPVPEPGTIMLFALGLVTLVARRKRR